MDEREESWGRWLVCGEGAAREDGNESGGMVPEEGTMH